MIKTKSNSPADAPTKKDDNANIEQKNWTHVRKIFGYLRYDCEPAQKAINDLYRNELRILQNLFLPSMKFAEKRRVGSKLKRRYDKPQTPLQRLLACPEADRTKTEELKRLHNQTDPFELAKRIELKLERIYQMANHRISPGPQSAQPKAPPLTRIEKESYLKSSESKSMSKITLAPDRSVTFSMTQSITPRLILKWVDRHPQTTQVFFHSGYQILGQSRNPKSARLLFILSAVTVGLLIIVVFGEDLAKTLQLRQRAKPNWPM